MTATPARRDASVRDLRPSRARRRRPAPLWRQALGARLREVRRERGEILTGLAARAGVSAQYLSEIERGLKDPSSEMVEAIAGALGLTLPELVLLVADDLSAGAAPGGGVLTLRAVEGADAARSAGVPSSPRTSSTASVLALAA